MKQTTPLQDFEIVSRIVATEKWMRDFQELRVRPIGTMNKACVLACIRSLEDVRRRLLTVRSNLLDASTQPKPRARQIAEAINAELQKRQPLQYGDLVSFPEIEGPGVATFAPFTPGDPTPSEIESIAMR